MILLVFFITFCNLVAQTSSSSLSMDTCIVLARRFHPRIVRAHKEWALAQITYQDSRRKWYPHLDPVRLDIPLKKNTGTTGSSGFSWQLPSGTNLRFQPSFSLFGQEDIDGDVYRFSHSEHTPKAYWWSYNTKFYSQLSVDQTVFGKGLTELQMHSSASDYAFQQAAMHYYDTVRQALYDTATSYRQLMRSLHQQQQTQQAIAVAKRQLKRYDLELQAGKIAKSVLLEHEASMLQSELSLLRLNTAIRQQQHHLKKLIGKPRSYELSISTDVPQITALEGSLADIIVGAVAYDSALMTSFAQVKQRANEQLIQQQSLWPTVAVRAELTTPYHRNSASYKTHFTTGIRMEVPIDTQQQRSSIAASSLQYQLAVEQFMQQCQDRIQKVSDDYQDLDYQFKALAIIEKRTHLAQRNFENAKLKHQNGMISTYELIGQQEQYQSSMAQIIAEKIQYLNLLDSFYLQTHQTTTYTEAFHNTLLKYYFKMPQKSANQDSTTLCRDLLAAEICESPINTV